jgi:hypothetical protein
MFQKLVNVVLFLIVIGVALFVFKVIPLIAEGKFNFNEVIIRPEDSNIDMSKIKVLYSDDLSDDKVLIYDSLSMKTIFPEQSQNLTLDFMFDTTLIGSLKHYKNTTKEDYDYIIDVDSISPKEIKFHLYIKGNSDIDTVWMLNK